MSKKNIVSIVVVIIVTLMVMLFLLMHNKESNKSYVDFNDLNTPEPVIDNTEIATGVYIEKEIYDNVDTTNDSKELSEKESIDMIAKEMEKQNIKGGITHEYYETIGEADYPVSLVNEGYTDWYTLTTDNGVLYAVIKNGEVIISKE